MRTILINAINTYLGYLRQYGDYIHVLNVAIHADEASIHAHMRKVYDHVNERGERTPGQRQALAACGILPPRPEEKENRYNSRKMTFDREGRAEWLRDVSRAIAQYRDKHPELLEALEPLKDLETEPEASRQRIEKQEFIALSQRRKISSQAEKLEELQDNIERGERQIEYIDAFRDMVEECEEEVREERAQERHRGRDLEIER